MARIRTRKQTIKRLGYLSDMISKYALRWNDSPSARLRGWVNEYNNIKEDDPDSFNAYCDDGGMCRSHDAYDCLA